MTPSQIDPSIQDFCKSGAIGIIAIDKAITVIIDAIGALFAAFLGLDGGSGITTATTAIAGAGSGCATTILESDGRDRRTARRARRLGSGR